MSVNKTLQLKRQTGFASVSAATTALQSAFASGKFAAGEPALAILTNGSVVLGIQGDSTHGSVFYNAATVDAAIAQAVADLKGNASKYLTLGALEGAIDEISGNTASYSISKTTTGLPAEVKERYNLTKTVGSETITVGTNIDIPKDSHIVSINYITTGAHAQNLEYVYIDVSGNTQTTYVDMSELVLEAEFASGVTITDHVAHGVVDPNSEDFLTVGAGGFKVSGIQNAINSAINGLDATKSGSTTHVSVKVTEADGKITDVAVTESDIASAAALTGETAARKAVTGQNGDTYTANSGTNYISSATSMNDADVKLDTQIKANADAIAGIITGQISVSASTATESAKYLSVTKSGNVYTVEASGIDAAISGAVNTLNAAQVGGAGKYLTAISETDGIISASASTLNAEAVAATAISQDQTHAAVTGTTVAAQIDSISKTLDTLGDEIQAQAQSAYSGVTSANAAISVEPAEGNKEELTFQLDTTTASNNITSDMLDITSNGLRMKDTFDCGTWS